MRSGVILLFVFVSFFHAVDAQDKFTISGNIREKATGESLPGVAVSVREVPGYGITTNLFGFYSITLKRGSYTLVFTSLGFQNKEVSVELNKSIELSFEMEQQVVQSKEVVISAEQKNQNVNSAQMGNVSISMDRIKTLPAFLGEVDLLKTIQLMPGVKSAGDGNTGFYVRGGGPDQNLILLDDAVIYNPSHLLGFFSVFNGDAVSAIELYKGGMPAQYGGRLASVLDVSMKEGNSKRMQVDGGIGLISSRITVQGPLKKDTASFILSARRTYADVVATPFIPESSPFKGSGIFFYDLNAKLNYRITQKDRLFLSGYFGRDKFSFSDKEADFKVQMPWGNTTSALRWNHIFNKRLFMNTSLIFSDFQFEFGGSQSDFEFKLFSGIRDYNAKVDFNFYPDIRHQIRFGANYIFHRFTPYNASASQGEVVFDTGKLTRLYAHEAAGYLSDDWDITDWLKIHAGIRMSAFRQVGPFDRFQKNPLGQITDTISYSTGENVVQYGGLEPRFSMRVAINPQTSIKASYTRNLQYIHMVSLSAVSLPTDVWVPCSELVKPQIGQQYALGIFRNFADDVFETSVEFYYKTMENQVEYKEGALPEDNLNDNADYNYTFGSGRSYGAELFIKKRFGDFTGWAGYTLSYTNRTFPGLNNGKTFYARYDRRHDGSLVLTYDVNKEWIFSTVFVYGTGNAITLPRSRYFIEGQIVNAYGERNAIRMAPYHRLDISVTWKPVPKREKNKKTEKLADDVPEGNDKWYQRGHSSWNFSIFNVYSRQNPFFLYFDQEGSLNGGDLRVVAKQVALFPILPSLTYNFSF
jgi:hypothetical protein